MLLKYLATVVIAVVAACIGKRAAVWPASLLSLTTAVAYLRTLVALYFVTVTGVMQAAFEVLYCVEVLPGKRVIEAFPTIDCSSAGYSRVLYVFSKLSLWLMR